ncbi:MAG: SDR family oxidoreductase [Myxococcota bacterium]
MGRTILITGATDGIGLQTAVHLAEMGHDLILHGRNLQRLSDAHKRATDAGAPSVTTVQADFSDLHQVRNMAQTIGEHFETIDVLINNAGVYLNERRVTPDGFEMTLTVNHIAPFVLTHALLSHIEGAEQGRIVNVSSVAHTRGYLNRQDIHLETGYDGYTAYAQSKLANVLFTRALARRLEATAVTVNALHPGVVATKMLKDGFGMQKGRHSHDEGAATSIRLATDDSLAAVTGAYFSVNVRKDPARQATDRDAEEWLYQWTAEVTGTTPR